MKQKRNKTGSRKWKGAPPKGNACSSDGERHTPTQHELYVSSLARRDNCVTTTAAVGQRRAEGTASNEQNVRTYLDGVRVQRAGVVSPNVVLVASSTENAPANQANPEVVSCLALLQIRGHAPGGREIVTFLGRGKCTRANFRPKSERVADNFERG